MPSVVCGNPNFKCDKNIFKNSKLKGEKVRLHMEGVQKGNPNVIKIIKIQAQKWIWTNSIKRGLLQAGKCHGLYSEVGG